MYGFSRRIMTDKALVFLFILIQISSSYGSVAQDLNGRTRRQLSFFGSGSGVFNIGSGGTCLGTDKLTRGVCLPNYHCNARGGKGVGFCGVFATCCSLNSCDGRTDSKVAEFANPDLTKESSGLECSYNIEINNNNVCQMRIDFENFNLAQPTTVAPVENVTLRPGYSCKNDVFQVTNLQTLSDIIPPLCGDNSGQHIYVRVNATLNSRAIRLNFKIADRNTQPNLPQATWKIKVTQLECFNTMGRFSDGILEAISSRLPSSPFITTADRDEFQIAPPGCLQYYPDRSGQFESFNYNRGQGPYLGSVKYSTCFKRTPDVCGVKFTPASFRMAYRDSANLYLDTDCQVNPVTQGLAISEDFIFIPEGETADGLRGSKFCGSSIEGQIIASTPTGPLYVEFSSDDLVTDGIEESGYRMNYNVLNNCNAR